MQGRLIAADGAGLAATQVGILQRIFVYRLAPDAPVEVLVNARIIGRSAERAVFLEGCLSFNTVAVSVERAAAIRVAAQDLGGQDVELEFDGFGASLLQHEIDHLDGILTLDRAEPSERRRAISQLLSIELDDSQESRVAAA